MRSDDGSLKEDNGLALWGRLVRDAMIASGRVPQSEELLRERLEKAGFVDVQSFTLRLPIGPWAKDEYKPWTAKHHISFTYSQLCLNRALKKVGMMMLLLAETGFHSYGMFAGECKKRCGG
jgi:hypothetical protein